MKHAQKPQFSNDAVAEQMTDLLKFIESDEFEGSGSDFDVIRDFALSAIGAVAIRGTVYIGVCGEASHV